MMHVTALADKTDVMQACNALGIPRATYYRHKNSDDKKPLVKRQSPLALSNEECKAVLDMLHSERFVDKSPGEIFSILLDENEYLCSERTMYRLLAKNGESTDRRLERSAKYKYAKPELLAVAPNQVWSWDISKLKGPKKWNYFYLYVVLDIFSRYVVGWLVADRESAQLAKKFIAQTCDKQNIQEEQLTLHADRGPSMRSKPVAFLLSDLGITKTHSRPYTSNDNPFSESQFKTLKYCPSFPERFGCIQDAKAFCRQFFRWYNNEHRHSGINRLTPKSVHYGTADEIIKNRNRVLNEAFARHPNRFKNRIPDAGTLPKEVWINQPEMQEKTEVRVA